jgi:hypothetical protein
MEPVPPFRGIRKVADSQRESTGISRTFDILGPVAVHLQTAQYYRHRHRQGQKLRRTGEEWLIGRLAVRYGFPDHVLHVPSRRMISVRPRRRSDFDRANFFHGLLGANVLFSHEEHDPLNKLEGVIQQ